MSDQPASGNNNNNNNRPAGNNPNNNPNNNRRPNNQRRRPQGPNSNPNQNREAHSGQAAAPKAPQGQGGQGQPPREAGSGGGQRRRHGRGNNRPRNPNPNAPRPGNAGQNNGPQGLNVERIYEKYLNLLDQHLIARRKYHDLFYRADPSQKNKLERNFYNTMNDVRDFESKLAPEARELFEKRNNGLKQDNIYTANHELPIVGENPPPETEWADPHFLQTQRAADYRGDTEESVGCADDYLRYKNLL